MEKLLSYASRLQQSPEEKDQKAQAFQVKRAQQQLESDILATEQSIAEAEEKLENAKSSSVYSSQAIIDAAHALKGYQQGLEELKAIKSELFPIGR
ncbi:unnamed protein product [Sphagnum balticum]